jgi:hypothetical protein
VFDENDPVVRAAMAPFEVRKGEYNRAIADANAEYEDQMKELDRQIAEREERLKEELARAAAEPAEEQPTDRVLPPQNLMKFGLEDDSDEETDRWSSSRPVAMLRPVRRARPVRDNDDEDFSHQTWLQRGPQP